MTAAQARTVSVAVGCLCITYGVIYAFTPSGFSWTLTGVGVLLTLPWLIARRRRDRARSNDSASPVPSWHPEFDG